MEVEISRKVEFPRLLGEVGVESDKMCTRRILSFDLWRSGSRVRVFSLLGGN